jgi:hypothetical protein
MGPLPPKRSPRYNFLIYFLIAWNKALKYMTPLKCQPKEHLSNFGLLFYIFRNATKQNKLKEGCWKFPIWLCVRSWTLEDHKDRFQRALTFDPLTAELNSKARPLAPENKHRAPYIISKHKRRYEAKSANVLSSTFPTRATIWYWSSGACDIESRSNSRGGYEYRGI